MGGRGVSGKLNGMRIFVLLPLLIVLGMSFSVAQDAKPELRTWTAVNGKEVEAEFVSNEKGIVKLKLKSGKVFEVPANKLSKEDNEFISSLANPEGVNKNELEGREGIMYLKGSDTPYTGKVFSLYTTGKKKFEGNLKDGKPDSLALQWHKNGQKLSEANFNDGKAMGLFTRWYDNGQKLSEGNFKDDKKDGLVTGWHENGQKRYEVNYKDGKNDGLEIGWHENGQKKVEVNYKDGKEDGLVSEWYENGKKEFEENFKNGKRDGLAVQWHENGQKKGEANFKNDELISGKWWNSKGEPVATVDEAK